METRRKAAAVAGVVVAAALTATGTWAYTNFVQNVTNPVDGTSTPGVRLHDDFKNVESAVLNQPENKDVYVENYGDHPQYVRIKLSEYLALDTKVLPSGATVDNKASWFVHTPLGTGANVADPDGDQFHDWWTWELGGQKWYMPTTNKDDTSTAADQDVSGTTYDSSTSGAKQTLDSTNKVITIAAWQALSADDQKTFQGWVWDTDGWVYWVGALQPGDATGLLVSSIKMTVTPEAKEFHYKIHVAMQAATSEDIAQFASKGGGITTAAAAMLNTYASKPPEVVLGMAAKTIDATVSTDIGVDLRQYITDPNYGDTLTYTVVAGATTVAGTTPSIDATDKYTLHYTPVAGDEGANHVIVVKATDAAGQESPAVTITLNVSAGA